ncbi:MAG: DoxX family protein [Prevotella sp.]|nr:DoxX family protein [Prevotella sp.]
MLEKYKDFLRNNDLGLLVLRLSMGGLMLFHGYHKAVYGLDAIVGMLGAIGMPSFLAYGALLCEVVAPILIILGVWTRAASAAMVANMIVAILMAHLGTICSVDPMTGGWTAELPALYLLGAAALCFTGGGRYALTKGTIFD